MCYFVFLLSASIIFKPTREVASELQTYFRSYVVDRFSPSENILFYFPEGEIDDRR